MRIGIDATSVPPQPAGAGVYAIELVRAMTELDAHDGYAVFTRGPWFDDAAAGKKHWRVEYVEAPTRLKRLLWEQTALPGDARRLGLEVLHSTHHTLPLRKMAAKRVVTIHDVTFFRMPERYPPPRRYYFQAITRAAAKVADAIIVPSQSVRADLIHALDVDGDKVHVVYEAAADRFRPIDATSALDAARRYGLDRPYVLSVGSLEPGKNRRRLIEAMHELRTGGIDFDLAIAGQRAWDYERDIDAVRELSMGDRVRFLGYVPDGDLPALYSAASVFAFPSLHEGFGLPVLEAMACGTPVVTSNVSATAEVAGDAALLVDPLDTGAIGDALRRLLTDAELRARLSGQGRARAGEFSWRRAAEETRDVYRSLIPAPAGTRYFW